MMELKLFKKTIGDFLIAKGFSKKGTFYYLIFQDIIIAIGLQKSNFSNGYYVNIGYIISELNQNRLTPRDVDGDIRARFGIEVEGKRADLFDLDTLSEDKLKSTLEENIKRYVDSVTSVEKLRLLLQENPVMLYQTRLVARQLLGFE